jgi:peptidoglycan/LPS O-acetylase OafA/YrhL
MVRRLLYINGLAIIAVVLFHSAGMGFVAMFSWYHRYGSGQVTPQTWVGTPDYYGLRFVEQIIVFAIPAFLFVSGYSIAVATGKDQKTVSWGLIFSRMRYLVIPYLIWTTVVLLLNYAETQTLSPIVILLAYITGSSNEVLYFVPLLMQFYLLSPLLVRWARQNWKMLLFVTAILQLFVQLLYYPELLGLNSPLFEMLSRLTPKWFFLSRVFWFPLGIICGFHPMELRKTFVPFRAVLVVVTGLLIPIGMAEWEIFYRHAGQEWLSHMDTLLDSVFTITFILSLLTLEEGSLPWLRQTGQLGSKSYGIYLTHAIFIQYTARLIYHFAPNLLAFPLLLQPIFISVGFGAPLMLMALVDRSPFRQYYRYLYG